MFWINLLFVFLFALLLGSILSWGFGWRHPARSDAVGASFLFLFLILLLAMWAGGVWFVPWGPVFYGTPWLELLLIGLFVSLLILAVTASARRPRAPSALEAQAQEESTEATMFGSFFWLLLIGLLVVIVVGYSG